MRIAELYGVRQFRMIEGSIAEPGPGEVQVRVDHVGICGSDLHAYSEGGIGDLACNYPMVLGHEPAGTIVKTGAGVTGWAPGDRAALEPAVYCYHCEFCRSGHHNVCSHIRFRSLPGDPGFFREYVNLGADALVPIPPSLSTLHATMVEPLAVALHSMKFIDIRLGETVAVFGAGPIGLLTIVCLKLAGAGRIWSVEPVAHRRELACRLGADVALDPQAIDPSRQILLETGNRGVDVAVDCAAKGDSMNHSIRAARNAGRVVLTGIPRETLVHLEISAMRRKELALFNVRRSNHESETARDLLATHLDRFAPMVTHTRRLEDVAPAFAQLERYEDGVGKLVIKVAD